jgi:hypothetical protein
VWRFLEHAQRRGKSGKLVQFKPNRARVSDVVDALNSVCSLDNLTDPPMWLNGAGELPAAGEMFPVANGLLHLPSGELYPPTPDYFGLTASDVVFDPDAREPKPWLAFLSDLWPQDAEAIVTLQGLVRLHAFARHLAAEDSVHRRPTALRQGHHCARAHPARRPRQRGEPDARELADDVRPCAAHR